MIGDGGTGVRPCVLQADDELGLLAGDEVSAAEFYLGSGCRGPPAHAEKAWR